MGVKVVINNKKIQKMQLVIAPLINITYGAYQQQQRAFEDRYQVKQIGPFKYIAVFDGHGGSEYRYHRQNNLNHIVDLAMNSLHNVISQQLSSIDINDTQDVTSAINNAFLTFDRDAKVNGALCGCTCTMLLIDTINRRIYQVNLGDSSSMIFNEQGIIMSSTVAHSPTDNEERARIELAGGKVINNRVNGMLAVSRAFGDYAFKGNNNIPYDPINGCVSSLPTVTIIDTSTTKRLYYLLTSDAPYEMQYFTNNDLVLMAWQLLQNDGSYEDIARKLVTTIVQHTTDDTTIVIGRC